jgi:hypothetical protein
MSISWHDNVRGCYSRLLCDGSRTGFGCRVIKNLSVKIDNRTYLEVNYELLRILWVSFLIKEAKLLHGTVQAIIFTGFMLLILVYSSLRKDHRTNHLLVLKCIQKLRIQIYFNDTNDVLSLH